MSRLRDVLERHVYQCSPEAGAALLAAITEAEETIARLEKPRAALTRLVLDMVAMGHTHQDVDEDIAAFVLATITRLTRERDEALDAALDATEDYLAALKERDEARNKALEEVAAIAHEAGFKGLAKVILSLKTKG